MMADAEKCRNIVHISSRLVITSFRLSRQDSKDFTRRVETPFQGGSALVIDLA